MQKQFGTFSQTYDKNSQCTRNREYIYEINIIFINKYYSK